MQYHPKNQTKLESSFIISGELAFLAKRRAQIQRAAKARQERKILETTSLKDIIRGWK